MIEFTETQKRTVATGLTILSTAVTLAFVAFLAWAALRILSLASAAIVPIGFGFFLSLFFKPYYRWWLGKVRNPTVALIALLVTVFVPTGVLLWYAGSVMVDEVANLIHQGPALVQSVTEWFRATFPKLHQLLGQMGVPYDSFGEFYSAYGATAIKAGASALKCLSGIVSVLLTLLFFVFFLMTRDRRGGEIVAQLPILKQETREFLAEQIDAFIDILVSFFQRQTVICLIEGVMYGTGFWLVGLPYGFLVGFALGVMNLIPLFGTVVCLPVALPLAYFGHDGSLTRLLLTLAVWAAGQFLDGYLITPKIQGDKTGLGYMGVIFSFFFWATILGPMLGMLLAIPLSAFCTVLWRAIKQRYLRPMI